MANSLYDHGRQAILEGGVAWLTDTIKAVLVDNGAYTVDLAAHQYLSDIPAIARISTSPNLTARTSTAGVADAADPVFPAVSGPNCEAVVLYKDTGTTTTSPLIGYIDTAVGLPVLPNGGDITVVFDNGVNRIFKL